jgi:hypothetical protein
MSRLSKKEEFHIPFIKELAFVGLVTIVSMISVHYFVHSFMPTIINPPNIIYTDSQITEK